MPEDLWLRCARTEHALWKRLTTVLAITGVVTKEDLEAAAGADDTGGERLLNLVREWGDARATLALAHAAAKKENPDG